MSGGERAMLREIERIIDENAVLLGEKRDLRVRVRPDGVRIYALVRGRVNRRQFRHYPTIERAHEAALEASRRAHRVHDAIASGVPKSTALRTVTRVDRP